jgi:Zn-dependent peptidase ImmA (M78 family)
MATNLENWVKNELFRTGVVNPSHLLNVKKIADNYGILLKTHAKPSISGEYMGVSIIKIDNRIIQRSQREQFFHELGHVLHHYGDQNLLPKPFVDYQEYKARNFALHYAVPTFMLHQLELPYFRSEAIEFIADTFKVTPDFAKEKLQHYEDQIIGARFYKELLKCSEEEEEYRPKVIDTMSDLPLHERPEMKELFGKFKENGASEEDINEIIKQIHNQNNRAI